MSRGRKPLFVKDLDVETTAELRQLAKSRTERKDLTERAGLLVYMLDHAGQSVQKAAPILKVSQQTLQKWIHRYNAQGLAGLADLPGRGRKADYTEADAAVVLKIAHTKPNDLGLSFVVWTMDELTRYLHKHHPNTISRTTIWTILRRNGFRWKEHKSWFLPLK